MKKLINKISLILLLIVSLIACNDFIERSIDKDVVLSSITRASASELFDYYWCEGKKIFLRRLENRSFILFQSSERDLLLQSLSKNGINVDNSKIHKFGYGGTDLSGADADSFFEFEWADVAVNHLLASDIPGVFYSTPYYASQDGYEFPLTNFIHVYLKKPGDIILLENLSKEYNLGIIGKVSEIPNWYIVACTKETKGNALMIANTLYESKLFEGVEPAFISRTVYSTNDFYYQTQWNLVNTGQRGIEYYGIDINFHNTLSLIPNTSDVVLAVVDTGVELTHLDLATYPFSWDAYSLSSPNQVYSPHGTNVAGIISAVTNNSIGIAGIAYPVKAMSLSNAFGLVTTDIQLALSIRKAVDEGASVINNSWGGGVPNYGINSAIDYAVKRGREGLGCVVVFASGNNNWNSISYPASYSPDSDVIAVGAISYNGHRKNFSTPDGEPWGSNYGPGLDIVAPGVLIPSTDLNNGYTFLFNGTSAAAPHVSAVAALILSVEPNLTYQNVAYIIENSARKLSDYTFINTNKISGSWNEEVGHGLLDAFAAVSAASPLNRTINLGYHYHNGPLGVYANCSGVSVSPSQSYNYQETNYTGHTITQTISVSGGYQIYLEEDPRGDYVITGEGTSDLHVTYFLSTSPVVINSLVLKFVIE